MDKYLEKLISELGDAINDAIHSSDQVTEVLDRIREAGHEVMLAVEATIALQEALPDTDTELPNISIEDRIKEISQEDRQFLRSLKIKFDQDD